MTGTDTGVGKTLVSSALLAAARARGLAAHAYKPVETGCPRQGGRLYGPDCRRLTAAAGGHQDEADAATYLFETPVAPMVAAELEGTDIDPVRIGEDLERISTGSDLVVVEGAGGLLVPITAELSYLDLARRLGLPLLLVVASKLGCINHSLLTLAAAESAGLEVLGYVLNQAGDLSPDDVSTASNREVLARLAKVPDLGLMPRLAEKEAGDAAALAAAAEANLDLAVILGL